MRFSITTNGPFVDMSTLALQATVTNLSTSQDLTILGPSLGTMFQEARIYLGNVECERVTFMNRTEAMLHRFLLHEARMRLFLRERGRQESRSLPASAWL